MLEERGKEVGGLLVGTSREWEGEKRGKEVEEKQEKEQVPPFLSFALLFLVIPRRPMQPALLFPPLLD